MITKFIDVTGKTEDEAVASALAQLGLERDDGIFGHRRKPRQGAGHL